MSLFATKPLSRIIEESEGGSHTLKRTLGPMNLVALGIGAIIGAGLFSLTGIAAANHAGPAVVFSFLVAAIGCAFAGMCYSEFATMIPIAGSAYTYSYATMGELLAWIQAHAKHQRAAWEIAQGSAFQDTRGPEGDPEILGWFAETIGKLCPTRTDVRSYAELLDLDDYVSFGGRA